jgi:hypothetical protein
LKGCGDCVDEAGIRIEGFRVVALVFMNIIKRPFVFIPNAASHSHSGDNMKILNRIRSTLIFACVVSSLTCASFAAEVAGVKLPETERLANQELKLNGAGIRYKYGVAKVYVAALYLPEKKGTTAEVLALPGPKRMTLVLLRDVSSNDLAQAFMDGIQKNSPREERNKVIMPLLKFGEGFASVPEFKKGDLVMGDWIPGTGGIFQVNGRKLGETINDALFYKIFMKIWLGDHAVEPKLKSALLGHKEETATFTY